MNKMNDLLKMSDFSEDSLYNMLDLADRLKDERKKGVPQNYLSGKTLGMIFQKSSTRTRVSFETGIYQLGGQGLFLSSRDLQIGRGEPIQDTARVLSRYLDAIMIRTYEQSEVELLAEYASIPVINALTDYAHPCQVLADFQTIREYKGKLDGLTMTFIGDGNNMSNSLIVGGLLAGMNVHIATPNDHRPHLDVLAFAEKYGSKFKLTDSPSEAATESDVLLTDVWASMGQEDEAAERRIVFKDFKIDSELMKLAKKDAMVLHCLPAHRGEEITAEVFEQHANEIFDEAENRLHAQKAVMLTLMG